MSFKERAVERLRQAEECEHGSARAVIRGCREMIECLADEEKKNECCAMPNYEGMYHEAMKTVSEHEMTMDLQSREIQHLILKLENLRGFKEATELIFGKACGCHGRCETA